MREDREYVWMSAGSVSKIVLMLYLFRYYPSDVYTLFYNWSLENSLHSPHIIKKIEHKSHAIMYNGRIRYITV